MIQEVKMWYARTFCIIYKEDAEYLGLTFYKNIYGDSINHLNCRSLWKDANGRKYRVHDLIKELTYKP